MEIIAAIIAAFIGWQRASLGMHEAKAIAIVVLGWTTVTTLASLPYVSFAGLIATLMFRSLLIAVPYAAAALVRRWTARRK